MTLSFTEAFRQLPPTDLEAFYRTVFMQMDTPYGADIRQKYFAQTLRQMGRNAAVGCGVKIVNPQHVTLEDGVRIEDHCTLIAHSERGITLREGTTLKYGCYLDTEGDAGYIETGKRVYIGTGSCLHGHIGLEIGDDTLLAQNITITPYSHRFDDPYRPISTQGGHMRKITIGKDCYLGKCVSVLYSAGVEDGSVVGAGSVVVQPIPPYSVAVGVPARVIHKRGYPRGSAAMEST